MIRTARPLPPLPPRPPWTAQVVQTHRWRYELEITSGGMAWTFEGVPIACWGSRQRAEAKAKRIIDRLNRRDALERQRKAEATEVR